MRADATEDANVPVLFPLTPYRAEITRCGTARKCTHFVLLHKPSFCNDFGPGLGSHPGRWIASINGHCGTTPVSHWAASSVSVRSIRRKSANRARSATRCRLAMRRTAAHDRLPPPPSRSNSRISPSGNASARATNETQHPHPPSIVKTIAASAPLGRRKNADAFIVADRFDMTPGCRREATDRQPGFVFHVLSSQ